MSAPTEVLALSRLGENIADDVPGLALEPHFEAASNPALAEAAEISLAGSRAIESGNFTVGARYLDAVRLIVADNIKHPAANPTAMLDFAHFAASTLAREAITRYADGHAPREVGISADMVRPHMAAGKLAIEAAHWSGENIGSLGVDLLVAAATASNLLPDGSNRGGSLLNKARLASWRQQEAHGLSDELAAARRRIADAKQAFIELERLNLPAIYMNTAFRRFETPIQREAKIRRNAAGLALRSFVKQPSESLARYIPR